MALGVRRVLSYWLLPIVVAAWLWGIFIARWATTTDEAEVGDRSFKVVALLLPLLAFPFVPALRRTLSLNSILSQKGFFVVLLVLMLAAVLSALGSKEPRTAVMQFVSFEITLVLCFAFSNALSDEQLEHTLSIFSAAGAVLLLLYYSIAEVGFNNRLWGIMNPNTIGMVAYAAVFSSLLFKNLWMMAAAGLPSLTVLLLTGSRSSTVALIIAVALWIAFRTNWVPRIATVLYACAVITIALIPFYFNETALQTILTWTSEQFAVQDPDRGVGTGATGRWDAWKATWRLFLEYPLLGVGYRLHQPHVEPFPNALNGYLAQLAEFGIIGTIPMAYFMMRGTRRLAAATQTERLSAWATAFLVGFYFYSCFEAALNVIQLPTNLVALLFLVRGYLRPAPTLSFVLLANSPSQAFWRDVRARNVAKDVRSG